jgi:hypothetical protein
VLELAQGDRLAAVGMRWALMEASSRRLRASESHPKNYQHMLQSRQIRPLFETIN